MVDVGHMKIFEGEAGKKIFAYDITALREQQYLRAGKFLYWSLIHGGPGLNTLHRGVVQLVMNQEHHIDINIMPAGEARDNLIKVVN